jgi:hypothetical protein
MRPTQVRPELSAHVGDALLGSRLGRARWPRRQLKHRCFLTCAQPRQQYGAPIGKFERIVMRGRPSLLTCRKMAVWRLIVILLCFFSSSWVD